MVVWQATRTAFGDLGSRTQALDPRQAFTSLLGMFVVWDAPETRVAYEEKPHISSPRAGRDLEGG